MAVVVTTWEQGKDADTGVGFEDYDRTREYFKRWIGFGWWFDRTMQDELKFRSIPPVTIAPHAAGVEVIFGQLEAWADEGLESFRQLHNGAALQNVLNADNLAEVNLDGTVGRTLVDEFDAQRWAALLADYETALLHVA